MRGANCIVDSTSFPWLVLGGGRGGDTMLRTGHHQLCPVMSDVQTLAFKLHSFCVIKLAALVVNRLSPRPSAWIPSTSSVLVYVGLRSHGCLKWDSVSGLAELKTHVHCSYRVPPDDACSSRLTVPLCPLKDHSLLPMPLPITAF